MTRDGKTWKTTHKLVSLSEFGDGFWKKYILKNTYINGDGDLLWF